MFQVCLAGLGPNTGEEFSNEDCRTFSDFLTAISTDHHRKVTVVFLGQLEGGRWLVRMKTEDEDDVSQLLIDEKVFTAVPFPSITRLEEIKPDVLELEAGGQETKEIRDHIEFLAD